MRRPNSCYMDLTYRTHRLAFHALQSRTSPLCSVARGYGRDYADQDDSEFERFAAEADALSIPRGVYPYSYALNVRDAQSEVAHMLRLLGPRKAALGVWLDTEDTDGYKAKNGMPSDATLVDICVVFCDAMESADHHARILRKPALVHSKAEIRKARPLRQMGCPVERHMRFYRRL